MDGEQVMTVPELADYLRVHRSTIYKLVKNEELPAFKVGADWRFLRSAIDSWINARNMRVHAPLKAA